MSHPTADQAPENAAHDVRDQSTERYADHRCIGVLPHVVSDVEASDHPGHHEQESEHLDENH